jgi:hypothetical protein
MIKYGTLIDSFLHLAPCAFMFHGAMITNPKAEHFAALNEERAKQGLPPYLPVVDEPPTTDAAHYAVATGWTRDGDTWRRVYDIRELPPPPPRTFDKYRLVDALMRRNVWEQVKAWLQSTPNAYDRAVMAPDISEDEPLLADGIAAVKELLGWTDAQVEEVLQEATI